MHVYDLVYRQQVLMGALLRKRLTCLHVLEAHAQYYSQELLA